MHEQLIKRAQVGDHRAFLELLRHYDGAVMSIVYRFSANRYDREDLYQEVFLQCFRSLASFKFQSSFKTWLTRVALNCCIDYMAKTAPALSHASQTYDDAECVEIDWERQQKLMAIHGALEQLAGPQRICFHMYYIEEWSLKEIMALLDCSEGTVKTHLHRARERIKTHTRVAQWQLNPI